MHAQHHRGTVRRIRRTGTIPDGLVKAQAHHVRHDQARGGRGKDTRCHAPASRGSVFNEFHCFIIGVRPWAASSAAAAVGARVSGRVEAPGLVPQHRRHGRPSEVVPGKRAAAAMKAPRVTRWYARRRTWAVHCRPSRSASIVTRRPQECARRSLGKPNSFGIE